MALDFWAPRPSAADIGQVLAKVEELQKQVSTLSLTEEPQPGFSMHMLLTLRRQGESSTPHYIIDYGAIDNTRFSVYLNDNGSALIFAILDGDGHRYSVDAAVESEVPLNAPFYLAASVGYGSDYSRMGLFVDNKKIRSLIIDRQVNTDYAKHSGIIGCDLAKTNCVSMIAYYLALYSRTLSKSEIEKMMHIFGNTIKERGIKPLPQGGSVHP